MTSSPMFRLIDSGVADGRRQIAYDAALVDLHSTGKVADTVRFLRFPPTVLIGRHQVMHQEVHVDRCREEGVGLVRRISGGGAIFLDPGQVGWELVFDRRTIEGKTLGDYARRICEAVALGLSRRFGIDARFRPRNDIEVGGRKLSGTGGFFVGPTLVYQGTVLVDMDAGRMARLLNIPASKLARHGAADATSRVVTLKELLSVAPAVADVQGAVLDGLATELGITTQASEPTPDELALTDQLLQREIGTDDFVFGTPLPDTEDVLVATSTTPGGTITVHLRLEGLGRARRVREIMLTGDFFVAPPRAVLDLEASLRGLPVADVGPAIDAFFAHTTIGLMSLDSASIRDVVAAALERSAGT